MMTSAADAPRCRWCGATHQGEYCPLVRSIEYDSFGCVKRVEFVGPTQYSVSPATQPLIWTWPASCVGAEVPG